jgi:hypothetical protein
MTATYLPYLRVDDVVTYSKGSTLYKITRVKQVKALAIESVTGRRVELRIEHCKPADKDAFVETEENLKPAPTLGLGMAVRFKNPNDKNRGVFVTLNLTAGGWRVARLGGKDGMRYFYNVEASRLEPVAAINDADWS